LSEKTPQVGKPRPKPVAAATPRVKDHPKPRATSTPNQKTILKGMELGAHNIVYSCPQQLPDPSPRCQGPVLIIPKKKQSSLLKPIIEKSLKKFIKAQSVEELVRLRAVHTLSVTALYAACKERKIGCKSRDKKEELLLKIYSHFGCEVPEIPSEVK